MGMAVHVASENIYGVPPRFSTTRGSLATCQPSLKI
jgi:hypothetical protein